MLGKHSEYLVRQGEKYLEYKLIFCHRYNKCFLLGHRLFHLLLQQEQQKIRNFH